MAVVLHIQGSGNGGWHNGNNETRDSPDCQKAISFDPPKLYISAVLAISILLPVMPFIALLEILAVLAILVVW